MKPLNPLPKATRVAKLVRVLSVRRTPAVTVARATAAALWPVASALRLMYAFARACVN